MDELRVLVLGAGDRGRAHVRAWKTAPDARVIQVVDQDADRARELAEAEEVGEYSTDWESALCTADADIVSVALPTCVHADAVVAAARRGMHIYCEKPIALMVDDAQRMIAAVREAGVQLVFCFQRRRLPVFSRLRELIQQGAIGRPVVHVQAQAVEIRPKVLMHDKRGNGGPLIDGWCHFVDVMRQVFGADPLHVMAQGFTFAEGHPSLAHIEELAIDTASVLVRFASGDLMTTTWSWGMPKGVRVPLMGQTLLGPRGAIAVGQHQLRLFEEGGAETVLECEKVSPPEATAAIARDLTRWARGEGKSDITGEDALVALKTSLAALESIETGETVRIS